jgi:membrane fusion protein (multidrug efflux system)
LIKAQIAKKAVRAPFQEKSDLDLYLKGLHHPVMPVANLVNTGKLKITFLSRKVCQSSKDQYCIEICVSGTTEKYSATVYAIEPAVEVATRTRKSVPLLKIETVNYCQVLC